jgi:hypothetical protein
MNGTAATETTGTVTGGVRTLLRLEGLTLLAGMTVLYALSGGSWWIYAILFLAPDLSFAATSQVRGRAPSSITPRTATWRRWR